MTTFDILPNEIIWSIMEYVPFNTAHSFLAVSRTWYLLLESILKKKHHDDLWDKLSYQSQFTIAESKCYSWWEYTHPDNYDRYDGRNIHRMNLERRVNFTIEPASEMTTKQFTKFRKLNGMVAIKGAIPWFHCVKPLFIRDNDLTFEIEEPYEKEYEHNSEDVYEEQWIWLRQLICSINSLKRRVILREDYSDNNNFTCDMYFLMRDGSSWHMFVDCTCTEDRYTNYNE
jgi:hypothetical protein